ncbi:MAG: SDR family oxidoreductase [Leptolyngbyaceae cyanobacterium]
MCERFAADGARHVAVVDLEKESAEAVASQIGSSAYGVDVRNEQQIADMVAAVEADQGQTRRLARSRQKVEKSQIREQR